MTDDDVLDIISAACPEFEQARQLVELIDAAWHKVVEEEKLSLSSVSPFFTDKSTCIFALSDVHNGDETNFMPRTLTTEAERLLGFPDDWTYLESTDADIRSGHNWRKQKHSGERFRSPRHRTSTHSLDTLPSARGFLTVISLVGPLLAFTDVPRHPR